MGYSTEGIVSSQVFSSIVLNLIEKCDIDTELASMLWSCSFCITLPKNYIVALFRKCDIWDSLLRSVVPKAEHDNLVNVYYESVLFFVTVFIFVERRNVYQCKKVAVMDELEYV